MMQDIPEDRFQLKIHREIREISGYVMTVDKSGFRLKPSQEGSCDRIDPTDLNQSLPAKPCNVTQMSNNGPLRVLDLRGVTLEVFAQYLRPEGKAVIDRTGLSGVFDIHLEFEPVATNSTDGNSGIASDPAPHASEIETIRRQLGLRLDPGKGTREILVIDHVERPSAN
jgi:bla regulator protein BlaR1